MHLGRNKPQRKSHVTHYTSDNLRLGNRCNTLSAQDGGRYDRQPLTRIEPGTTIAIRTSDYIDSNRADGRVFRGTVAEEVRGENGRVGIPRDAPVELMVGAQPDHDLVIDIESVMVDGRRYAVRAEPSRIDAGHDRDGVGGNQRTGEYVGGGAALGAIIGAIAGGGKGAAVGAAAGAAAGAGSQMVTRGREVRIPRESLLTFRIERPMEMGVADRGVTRDGFHYHDYDNRDDNHDDNLPR